MTVDYTQFLARLEQLGLNK